MNREDIIRMAREAGIVWNDHTVVGSSENLLECFAELVAAAEREECAKVCDEQGKGRYAMEHYAALTYSGATQACATAIRARGEQ